MGRLGDKWYRIAIDGDFNGAFYSMDLDGENERQIGPFSQFPFGVFGKSLFYEDKCILATNEADFDPETGEVLGITSGIYRYHLDSRRGGEPLSGYYIREGGTGLCDLGHV